MEFYTVIIWNTVERYQDYVVVCAMSAACAEVEAMKTVMTTYEHPLDWKIVDMEIWD